MIIDLGLIDYEAAYRIQREVLRERKCGARGDTLIFAEHLPVLTIGRSAKEEHLAVGAEALRARSLKVIRVDRGGDITFHGPGQVVAYPIVDLKRRGRDLHRYLRDLEEVVIDTAHSYGVLAYRVPGRTGVWTGGKKVASLGIGTSAWCTYHGIGINIDTDLTFFSMIHPCGHSDVAMTNLALAAKRPIALGDARERLIASFKRCGFVFGEYDARPCAELAYQAHHA